MKLEKRVQIVLPIRVFVQSADGPTRMQVACTYDISEFGARLAGVQGIGAVGDIVTLERSKSRAMYRVMWIGKSGTPLHGHIGVRSIQPDKVIWDVNLAELEEQYEAIIADTDAARLINIPASQRTGMSARGMVFSESLEPFEGTVTQLSYTGCTLSTPNRVPTQSPVQLLVITEEADVRLQGQVNRCEPPLLSIALAEVRRGDRNKLKYILEYQSTPK